MPNGKVVLVTGASAGIGYATCEHLVRAGWTVVGASRRGLAPDGCEAVAMDVDVDESVSGGIRELTDRHGRLDAVVANAGWGLAGPVECTSTDEVRAQFETNFFGVVRTVRTGLPHLRDAPHGRIVIVSSIAGLIGIPFQAFYSASKFALEGYGESLAYELRPFGVDVTLVEPGNIRTDFTAVRRAVHRSDRSPYAETCDRAIALMEKGEADGVDPRRVAIRIERLLKARHPRRRVSVGKFGERVGIPAKRLLSHRLFEMGARSSLGV